MGKTTMGCGPTKEGGTGAESETREPGHCVIEFVRACNVPKMDAFDTESDPYIKAHIESTKRPGHKLSKTIKTQGRRSTIEPVWNSARDFQIVPVPDSDVLVMELYDHDSLSSDDIIGKITLPLWQLEIGGKDVTVQLQLEKGIAKLNGEDCSVVLRRHAAPTKNRHTIFVIRHGESKWNEACEEKNVSGLADFDHELSLEGIKQAEQLNETWKQDTGADATTKLFKEAKGVVASPLTRAVQTALVGLHGHPAIAKGLLLSRVIREKKNRVGLDTVGNTIGDAIAVKVEKKLGHELKDPAKAQQLMVPIDPGDAHSDWWTKPKDHDNEERLVERLTDFLGRVHMLQQHGYIFVGHSLFFKQMMVSFCGKTLKDAKPDLYEELRKCKFCNAGCASVTIEYPEDGKPEIVDVELMFGTTLLDH